MKVTADLSVIPISDALSRAMCPPIAPREKSFVRGDFLVDRFLEQSCSIAPADSLIHRRLAPFRPQSNFSASPSFFSRLRVCRFLGRATALGKRHDKISPSSVPPR